ncbi:ATP-binding protein [Polyangium mundeleinium]|uniref:histidine kinase n=1 Tax=Polyangium mundeleinium TaxID=2995306 RepID=A0ABT5EMC5_9BACT|nr:ATP-binding protein [Polyangium mundeleinium]MDC0742522.1 ATP-binding protein [Polyangium mundeleinium]
MAPRGVQDAAVEGWLAGGGEMGALMRSFDWSRTSLGPVSGWPRSLKTMAGVVLNTRFPMVVWWGPELLQAVYNDAFQPMLGNKHPALGAPSAEVWAEVWDVAGPMAQSVLEGAPATWEKHLLLWMQRRGFVEETYFTFSYSPIPDDDGRVGGVLNTVHETTEQIQDDRQLRMLRDLAAHSAEAQSAEEACRTAATIFASNQADLPFALLYLADGREGEARLVGESGLAGYEGPAKPAVHPVRGESSRAAWPLAEAARTGRKVLVEDLAARFGVLPGGGWGSPPERAIVLPLVRTGQPEPYGFLVAGLSPHRLIDERYCGLFRLAADQVVTTISNVRAYEEARARAEALAAIDRAKTAFFSNASHELRTPLTLILGPVEDALASGAGVLAGEGLRWVHRSTIRLAKLVNALLDVSQIEAGRIRAAYEPTDLAGLTIDLASTFRSAFERAGLGFEVDCPALPEPVFVDPDMWEKIVLNLLSNALKFTFEGKVRVALRAAGSHVELTVEDTGTGIAAHELPLLFDRFHRVQGARARTHEGSGIGLALVQELARLHGGRAEVTSELGRGTRFLVVIPFGVAHLPADRVRSEPSPASARLRAAAPYVEEARRWLPGEDADADGASDLALPPARGALASPPNARILLADDNADMRGYVGRILGEHWKVEAVGDGAAALEAARASRPDLVLTDVMMPNLDGFGLLRALRDDAALCDVPVIMLSARAGDECRVEGLQAGVDDYLSKPFSARELVARVALHLQLAELRHRAVREREKMYALFMQAPVAIASLRGPRHVFELANPHYEVMVGKTNLAGRAYVDVFPELADHPIIGILDRVYTTGVPYVTDELELDIDRGSGHVEESYFGFNLYPVRGESGEPEGFLCVAVDVTERVLARKRLEEAMQEREELLVREQEARRQAEAANRSKDEFLAMLGHELRNPLAPITTALYLMRMRAGDVAARERAVIERQVKHLAQLVDDLLDVSRITRGKVELKKERLEVAEVVAKAIEMASPLLEQRRHHLTVEVPSRGLVVDGDGTRLAQVMSNLLTNAAKYTESGGQIAVEAERRGRDVEIRVRDNGIGIAADVLPSIFDFFVQDRQSIDRAQGGLGLGLAIVRNLVTMHGGTVSARSEGKGRGSEFVVRLPGVAGLSEGDAARTWGDAPVGAAVRGRAGHRILVVDDNEDAAMLLAESLGSLGHQTQVASDGPSALRLAEKFRPDIALLDIGLPVMDGYELAHRLREQPELDQLRLIAVTGYGQASDRSLSQKAGFDAHLVKPVQFDRLAGLVEELFGQEGEE